MSFLTEGFGIKVAKALGRAAWHNKIGLGLTALAAATKPEHAAALGLTGAVLDRALNHFVANRKDMHRDGGLMTSSPPKNVKPMPTYHAHDREPKAPSLRGAVRKMRGKRN